MPGVNPRGREWGLQAGTGVRAGPVRDPGPSAARMTKAPDAARPAATARPRNAPRPLRYARKRAAVLALVYLLMGIHIAHWKASGKTLAPLELNEVMYTLELGIVTAGFVFMCVAMLSVLLFGRFFCSWGCHILALEDLCAWLLGKIGIKPRPIRSRLLLLVPPLAMFYMFLWPQTKRLLTGAWPALEPLIGNPPPFELRVLGDQEGWASFVTQDYWRNLPGPWIAVLTFLSCGFAIVWVLGSRAFCAYGCPYGVLFAVADRFAPGRIVLRGECTGCGHCTAVCDSHVRVHEEIAAHGRVVNPDCLKDLDCVSVCPTQGIGFRFAKPAFFAKTGDPQAPKIRYDLSWPEELLAAGAFLATLLVFRGLYASVPFLMTLGLGSFLAWVFIVALRLVRRPNVRFVTIQLRRDGRWTAAGRVYALATVLLLAFMAHSGVIRWHEARSQRLFGEILAATPHGSAPPADLVEETLGHLRFRETWGLHVPPELDQKLLALYGATGRTGEATPVLARMVARDPGRPDLRLALAEAQSALQRYDAAETQLREALRLDPRSAPAWYNLGVLVSARGDDASALACYESAVRCDSADADSRNNLGHLLGRLGRTEEALAHLREAVRLKPDSAVSHFNLAGLLAAAGRKAEAEEHLRRAAAIDPRFADAAIGPAPGTPSDGGDPAGRGSR